MSAMEALERLGKWRSVFAGWQLGTRPKGDPESDAVRDHREATIILRAEANALAYEARFPGIWAVDHGLVYDGRVAETMKGWLL